MLSRLACRAGALVPAAKCSLQSRAGIMVSVRLSSTESEFDKHVNNWDKANAIYYGPDRDHANFPIVKQPETCPPVRLGFIPDSFFQFFYEKTGVTGPYMFGFGTLTFLLSKEIWVVEHNFAEFIAFWAAIVFITKKFGPSLQRIASNDRERYMEKFWYGRINENRNQITADISKMDDMIASQEGQKYLFEAKRENVDLQLEATYRQQLMEVYQATKKRLDYQLEVENTKRRYEQQNMVKWIVDNVIKGITPQQEKESISKCIQDLKALSTRMHAA